MPAYGIAPRAPADDPTLDQPMLIDDLLTLGARPNPPDDLANVELELAFVSPGAIARAEASARI